MSTVFILTFITYLLAFIFGYIYGKYGFITKMRETPREDIQRIIHSQKPGGIFKENIPSGAIQRPSVDMINKWNEDPKIKAEKDAMKETFDADPELKALREEYKQSAMYK